MDQVVINAEMPLKKSSTTLLASSKNIEKPILGKIHECKVLIRTTIITNG